ncbi:GIY-YIG nuclease family protein, partial [Patescibacteria group bacterium]|nr:GIY-YIG nuclease family protein [Patescibacteria group bacterium]
MIIKELPENSGVYIFKDKNEVPIYVGKASNIRKRVKSHFHHNYRDPKEAVLINKVKIVDAIKVDSDIESLILEADLIKKYKPIYNTQLKDDKDYLYIKITSEDFPKVLAARKRGLKGAKEYFGPFPSANRVRTTL